MGSVCRPSKRQTIHDEGSCRRCQWHLKAAGDQGANQQCFTLFTASLSIRLREASNLSHYLLPVSQCAHLCLTPPCSMMGSMLHEIAGNDEREVSKVACWQNTCKNKSYANNVSRKVTKCVLDQNSWCFVSAVPPLSRLERQGT